MATIVLSSVGRMFGPIGQIVGTLAGNAIDNAIFGSEEIEGARLTELAVTGSSYGRPIARQYGKVRAGGTIIWSTDLQESREKQGNGKGQPDTVTYSYSVSFAVALSSRPIDGIGRIWADGNLLRGAAGDLKSAGTLRVYRGLADQPRDPLMEGALGIQCPAFRGQAYAVFENLDLTDFGNRIPALSFEILAGDGAYLVGDMAAGEGIAARPETDFPQLQGFSHEGGSVRDVVRLVDRLHPISAEIDSEGVTLGAASSAADVLTLPPPAAWTDGDFGTQGGVTKQRSASATSGFAALRYYDPSRDYQAGMQLAENSEEKARTFEFPGALSANSALDLVREANTRAATKRDRMQWRCTQLDPAIVPGSLVRAEDIPGVWQVTSWEWREAGIELELERYHLPTSLGWSADAGAAGSPLDRLGAPTRLHVIEPPWDGKGSASARHVFAAAGAEDGLWAGCALYATREGALIPLDQSVRQRAVIGELAASLEPSTALRFEPAATCAVSLLDHSATLTSTDMPGLSQGANRLLVGSEVLQFLSATPLGDGEWQLTGLLRGRGGSEAAAAAGHESATAAILLDERLLALTEESVAASTGGYAAIGPWDSEPALAELESPGASLRPLVPVHARFARGSDGSVALGWTRRARGQWLWRDEVEQPLVEESEAYEIGLGPLDAPLASWTTALPKLAIAAEEASALVAAHGAQPLWVRQLGSFGRSPALALGQLT